MKKLVLLLGLLLSFSSVSFANCEYKCVQPYDMNSGFRTFLGAVSGVNSLSESVAQRILKREIAKNFKGKNIEAEVQSSSSKDLKEGRFKYLYLSGEDLIINEIPLSYLEIKTLCDFNYIKQVNNDVIFMEDLPVSFNFRVSENDVNKILLSKRYQRVINGLNKIGKHYGKGIQITKTKVAIKSNKFYYVIGVSIPFLKNIQKLVINSDLQVKDGRIDFANTRLVSNSFEMDLKNVDFILNYLNPLDFPVHLLKNKDMNVVIKSVNIKNNEIVASGIAVVSKD